MKDDQALLDLCRLNLMEETVEKSPANDRDTTMSAIDMGKRDLVMKIKPGVVAPGVMEKHIQTNTRDVEYP